MSKTKEQPETGRSPRKEPGKPVSLRFLAEYLGLSRATVSLVLNDSPVAQTLSAATRERVLKAAKEFNYRANYFARYLNKKQSFLIGIIAPDLGEGYDSAVLTGIERQLIESGYLYLVASHHWDPSLIRQRMDFLVERGAEGIILINTEIDSEAAVPVISIGSHHQPAKVARISIDNSSGVEAALSHLCQLGHKRIAFLKGHEGSSDTNLRWEGVLRAMKQLQLKVDPQLVIQLERINDGLSPIEEGYVSAKKLLERAIPFSALFAFNDMSAIGAMNAFRDAGYRIPQDISVVGFDDVQAASAVYPPLTTIRQPLREIGMLAAKEILSLIQNANRDEVPELRLLEPKLILRQSTCPLLPEGDRNRQVPPSRGRHKE